MYHNSTFLPDLFRAIMWLMDWQTLGFEKIKDFFEKTANSALLSHAYIFSGQEMIGKRTFAVELADFFRGEDRGGLNPNLFFLDQSSSESGATITIDEVRRAKNFLSLSPYSGSHKFAIIDNAHLMTDDAQNALLKILEEPSASSVLILISSNSDALLPTIKSRCQEIKFPPHSQKTVDEFLSGHKINQAQADFLSKFSNGRIGLVKTILDNGGLNDLKKSVEELAELTKADLNKRFSMAQAFSDEKSGGDLQRKILYWMLFARTKINEPKIPNILRNLLELYKIISQPQFNRRLALESFIISI